MTQLCDTEMYKRQTQQAEVGGREGQIETDRDTQTEGQPEREREREGGKE